MINFAKRAKTAEVIRDIQQYQNVAYSLQPVPELQDYIVTNMTAAGDVHEMYDKSLQIEPREREDEKIVRYVSDTFRRLVIQSSNIREIEEAAAAAAGEKDAGRGRVRGEKKDNVTEEREFREEDIEDDMELILYALRPPIASSSLSHSLDSLAFLHAAPASLNSNMLK